ncbi:hypothetical protein, partial [uncultured Tateyamaria sp.]|uniref:hypothetical protein n=1 Tax=uncultured Tateyamaria sp. TaxID=455651 RepID=UPI0026250C5B
GDHLAHDPRKRTLNNSAACASYRGLIIANPSLQAELNQRLTIRSSQDFPTKYARKQTTCNAR